MDAKKADAIGEEDWPAVEAAIDEAIDHLQAFRSQEGEALYKDVTGRVQTILSLYDEVEKLEGERIETVKARLLKNLEELAQKPDPARFEQELIFYLEKYDINEEKVRLRQHCRYFMETIDGEPYPGKKLGFIIQEMGREINTTGSKANHAGIQEAAPEGTASIRITTNRTISCNQSVPYTRPSSRPGRPEPGRHPHLHDKPSYPGRYGNARSRTGRCCGSSSTGSGP